jgi:hypothetical protein
VTEYLPSERDLPPAVLGMRKEHLVSEINGHSKRRRLPRWGRWLAGITSGIILVGGGATVAAATGVWSPQAPSPATLDSGCYAKADLNADTTIIGTAGGLDPIAACAQEWRNGAVKHGVHTAPSLVGCILHDGGPVGVFPGGRDTCKKLGLRPARPLTEQEHQQAVAFGTLENELITHLSRCVSKADAVEFAEERLKALHITGWRVILDSQGRNPRCAIYINLDPQKKAVLLG